MKIMASEMAKIQGEGRYRAQNKDRTSKTAMNEVSNLLISQWA